MSSLAGVSGLWGPDSAQCASLQGPNLNGSSSQAGSVQVQIVHGSRVLQTHSVDREAAAEQSQFFERRLGRNWCSNKQQQQQQQHPQPVVIQLHVNEPAHLTHAVLLLRYLQHGLDALPPHLQPPQQQRHQQDQPSQPLLSPSTTTAAEAATPTSAAPAAATAAGNAASDQQQLAGAASPAAAASERACYDACVLASLADRYVVPQLLSHLVDLLGHTLATAPCWSAVLFVLRAADDGLSRHPAFPSRLQAPAHAFMLGALQDLEGVLGCRRLCGVLLGLPLGSLLLLLEGPGLRVAAETSVLHAVTAWLCAQPSSPEASQLSRLAGCIRLRGLPRTLLHTLLPQLQWYTDAAPAGVVHLAATYLQQLDAARAQLGAAAATLPHTPCSAARNNNTTTGTGTSAGRRTGSNGSGSSPHSGGSPSSSTASVSSPSPELLLEQKALQLALPPSVRADPFWSRALAAPRAPSAVGPLVLRGVLSMQRLGASYNSAVRNSPLYNNSRSSGSGSGSGSGGCSDSRSEEVGGEEHTPDGSGSGSGGTGSSGAVWQGEWQPTRDGTGCYAGLAWQLMFRWHGVCACGGGCGTQKQRRREQQQPSGSSKRQRRELAEATSAAAAAAGGEEALLHQVLLDSLVEQQQQQQEQQQQEVPLPGAPAAGTGSPITPTAPAAVDGSNGGSTGGSSGGGTRLCRKALWALQFGVSFSVPFLPPAAAFMPPTLTLLTPPRLQHRLAQGLGPGVATRAARALRCGLEPGSTPQQLAEGGVMPCGEVLPLGLSARAWDEGCEGVVRGYCCGDGGGGEEDDRLRVRVAVGALG